MENDDVTVDGGEHGDLGPQEVIALLLLIEIGVLTGEGFKRVIGIHRALFSETAPEAFRHIGGNPPEPGLESAVFPEPGQLTDRGKQDLLGQLVCLLPGVCMLGPGMAA